MAIDTRAVIELPLQLSRANCSNQKGVAAHIDIVVLHTGIADIAHQI